MFAEALFDVAWNRSQQSAHFLTPNTRPWKIHSAPDGRLSKQVIVDVIEDFGQGCDRVPSLAAKYQIPLSNCDEIDPQKLANVILGRHDEFQQAYRGAGEINMKVITGATTLKLQFSWPDANLGIC